MVLSKLSDAAGAYGSEAIEMRNWLIHFGCATKELRVDVANLDDWMANPPPPPPPPLGRLSRTYGMSCSSSG